MEYVNVEPTKYLIRNNYVLIITNYVFIVVSL